MIRKTKEKKVVVTGGAGYIGSHVVAALVRSGVYEIIVVDNLSTGNKGAVLAPAVLVQMDLADEQGLDRLFQEFRPHAVLHFAAYSKVSDSISSPAEYFENNVVNSLRLLNAMKSNKVNKVVFSSTAAVYAVEAEVPLTENAPIDPVSPYGKSKHMFEQILSDYDRAYGLKSVTLRYFNAAGADAGGGLCIDFERKEDLVAALVKAAMGKVDSFTIYGTDYDTPDGACIRDLIHVSDLASAHLLALDYLDAGGTSRVLNLGSDHGYSVREAAAAARRVTGVDFPVKEGPRRAGDITVSIASSKLAREVLGWQPQHSSLEEIIGSAWTCRTGTSVS